MALPPITDQPTTEIYTAASGQQLFGFIFAAFVSDSVYVLRNGVSLTRVAVATSATEFDVAVSPDGGGDVHLGTACVAGETISILRSLPISRLTRFPSVGPVPMSAVNLEFDRHIAIMQDLRSSTSRAMLLPLGELGTTIAPASQRLGGDKLLGFDPLTGAPLVVSTKNLTKGDPGGNVMAIGSFTAAGTLSIPGGTDVVRTRGHTVTGIGVCDYVADAAVNAAYVTANPRSAFISANGRGFRLIMEGGVRVTWFGAVGDGVTDDTAAFDAAIATGRTVFIPKSSVGYLVNGIKIVGNMELVGEKSGECLGPVLIAKTSNGSIFLQAPTTEKLIPHLRFSKFVMRANTGVTNASGFKSTDQTDYSGYALFNEIESERTLLWAYDALFIYATWRKCRDGYLPGIGTFTSAHGFIKSEATTFSQGNATNTNTVEDCMIFRAMGVDGAIQLAKGDTWTINTTRWEDMDAPAIRASSIRKLVLNGPRAEGSRMTPFMTLNQMAGSGGVGTTCVVRDGLFALDTVGFTFAGIDAVSRCGIYDTEFAILRTGSRLTDYPAGLTGNSGNLSSGTGAIGFFAGTKLDTELGGRKMYSGAIDNGNQVLSLMVGGGVAASAGFTGGNAAIAVGAAWVTIFTAATRGGKVMINGTQVGGGGGGGGTPALWEVNFVGPYTAEIVAGRITPFNAIVAEFQTAGNGVVQMRCTTGACNVEASALC